MAFIAEISNFIADNYDGEIQSHPIIGNNFYNIYLPEKKVVFIAIPKPEEDLSDKQENIFQNLSIDLNEQSLQAIMVWEDLWFSKNEIVKWRILSQLGKFKRIHARQCEIKRITKIELDLFLTQNHLYGSPTAKHKYGLFYKQQLVAVASFSAGRPIERCGKTYRSYELVRFANYQNCIVVGAIGKLLSYFIEQQKPDDIMSYADLDWSSGKSYEKLGFNFIEYSPAQMFYINKASNIRYYQNKNKQELNNILSIQPEDFIKAYNSGNKKYLMLIN